ncbi:MAG: hypothetical protein GFH27_549313n141 [Chloroflexi bacterium AL-W]|nr:hypothetical protein [Chloroflexi bacterium AL-N1]NOK69564.1 hypothetical protein [Chloroflexi bacterium AL-N10]NOK77529.1 hypothetical protein [Chloroflexi bacterium AL-N5]NOK84380.1 hypothetical protein [Chloroflexi bacterium AL-W]NOK91454.1 hypothetical protein [Chloroflexi bacterium AL-N15]
MLNLGLIALQPIPVVGACVLPLMCGLNYIIYRKVLEHGSTSKLQRTFAPVVLSSKAVGSGDVAVRAAPATQPLPPLEPPPDNPEK